MCVRPANAEATSCSAENSAGPSTSSPVSRWCGLMLTMKPWPGALEVVGGAPGRGGAGVAMSGSTSRTPPPQVASFETIRDSSLTLTVSGAGSAGWTTSPASGGWLHDCCLGSAVLTCGMDLRIELFANVYVAGTGLVAWLAASGGDPAIGWTGTGQIAQALGTQLRRQLPQLTRSHDCDERATHGRESVSRACGALRTLACGNVHHC